MDAKGVYPVCSFKVDFKVMRTSSGSMKIVDSTFRLERKYEPGDPVSARTSAWGTRHEPQASAAPSPTRPFVCCGTLELNALMEGDFPEHHGNAPATKIWLNLDN